MAEGDFASVSMSGDPPTSAPDPLTGGSDSFGSAESSESSSSEFAAPEQTTTTESDLPQASVSAQQAEHVANSGIEEDRLLQLEQELSSLRDEHETLRGQYARIAADFDNFRKRQSRDQDDLKVQLTCSTLGAILPVVDNFERARQQLDPQGEEAQGLHRSYQGLYKQLVDVLKQLGVAPMRVVGQVFDPTLHEAVLREPNHEHPEDVVIEELQRGYHLDGRVLRHALVKVSMGPGPDQPASESATLTDQAVDASGSDVGSSPQDS